MERGSVLGFTAFVIAACLSCILLCDICSLSLRFKYIYLPSLCFYWSVNTLTEIKSWGVNSNKGWLATARRPVQAAGIVGKNAYLDQQVIQWRTCLWDANSLAALWIVTRRFLGFAWLFVGVGWFFWGWLGFFVLFWGLVWFGFWWLSYIYFEKLADLEQSCILSRVSITFGTNLIPHCQALSFLLPYSLFSSSYQVYDSAAIVGDNLCCFLNCFLFYLMGFNVLLCWISTSQTANLLLPPWSDTPLAQALEFCFLSCLNTGLGASARGNALWYPGWTSTTEQQGLCYFTFHQVGPFVN